MNEGTSVLVLARDVAGAATEAARRFAGSVAVLASIGVRPVLVSIESPRAGRRRDGVAAIDGLAVETVDAPWGLLAGRRTARAVAGRVARAGATVVQAHGAAALRAALDAVGGTGARVVAVVDADEAAGERLSRGVGDSPGTLPDASEAAAVRAAHAVVYGSRALAARFPSEAPRAVVPGVLADARIPADPDAERLRGERRRAMGLSDESRVVAAVLEGGGGDEVARLAAVLAHAMERVPQMRALVVAPDAGTAAAAKDSLGAAGVEAGRGAVVAPPLSEVVPLLLAADAGVLLRRPALANAVAFPASVGDLWAAGLQAVVSAALPEVADRVQRAPVLGHVLTWKSEDAVWAARVAGAARPQDADARAQRRAFARAQLSSTAASAAYRAVYRSVTQAR